MGARPGDAAGIIYGDVQAVQFKFAASDPHVKRLDYIAADHPGGIALGQVVEVNRHSQLSFDEAVTLGQGGPAISGDHVSCTVRIIGYRDDRGLLQVPRTPFKAGTEVRYATPTLIQKVLGLTVERREGAFIGHLRNTEIPVVLDVNHLVQKHVSILAKTGAGKSYTVGVLLEELLLRKVPVVIVDPHGEYTTLANPNIEPGEIDNMRRFGIKPRGFHRALTEYTLEEHTQGRERLTLKGEGLEARELVDVVPAKLSSAQVGILYQAVNELKKYKPYYTLDDIVQEVSKNASNAKWSVVSALENLQATGLFTEEGTALEDVVKPGHATVVNLKGSSPDIQEIAVARLARILFDARKRGKIPPFMFVVEEAHNFCPERGLSTAVSGPELKTIASEGRKFGMGLLIVSQRPAKVDKNVLSQCNTQIIMKVTNPNDIKAISSSVEGITGETTDEIQRLGIGVSLVAGGNLVAPVLVEVRTRMSRHGGRSVSVLVDEEDAEGEGAAVTHLETGRAVADIAEPEAGPQSIQEIDQLVAADDSTMDQVEDTDDPRDPFENFGSASATASDEDDDSPGPWSPDAPFDIGLQLLEPEPPIHEADEAEPGPLGEPQDDLIAFEHLGVPSEATPRPTTDSPAADAPRLRPSTEPEELAVMRVVQRLGYSQAKKARDAVAHVKRMAHAVATLSPEEYVRRFVHIGRTYCHSSLPDCGPCPLLDTCRLGQLRLANGEVRRGRWGSRVR